MELIQKVFSRGAVCKPQAKSHFFSLEMLLEVEQGRSLKQHLLSCADLYEGLENQHSTGMQLNPYLACLG